MQKGNKYKVVKKVSNFNRERTGLIIVTDVIDNVIEYRGALRELYFSSKKEFRKLIKKEILCQK